MLACLHWAHASARCKSVAFLSFFSLFFPIPRKHPLVLPTSPLCALRSAHSFHFFLQDGAGLLPHCSAPRRGGKGARGGGAAASFCTRAMARRGRLRCQTRVAERARRGETTAGGKRKKHKDRFEDGQMEKGGDAQGGLLAAGFVSNACAGTDQTREGRVDEGGRGRPCGSRPPTGSGGGGATTAPQRARARLARRPSAGGKGGGRGPSPRPSAASRGKAAPVGLLRDKTSTRRRGSGAQTGTRARARGGGARRRPGSRTGGGRRGWGRKARGHRGWGHRGRTGLREERRRGRGRAAVNRETQKMTRRVYRDNGVGRVAATVAAPLPPRPCRGGKSSASCAPSPPPNSGRTVGSTLVANRRTRRAIEELDRKIHPR